MESPLKTMTESYRRRVVNALFARAVQANGISQSTITTATEMSAVYSVRDVTLAWLNSWTSELTLEELIDISEKMAPE